MVALASLPLPPLNPHFLFLKRSEAGADDGSGLILLPARVAVEEEKESAEEEEEEKAEETEEREEKAPAEEAAEAEEEMEDSCLRDGKGEALVFT